MRPNSSLFSRATNMPGTFEATPWLQFQLSLAPPKPLPARSAEAAAPATDWVHERQMATARTVAHRVLRALAPLRRGGAVCAAYVQRKEPGLRWRVAAADVDAVRAALAPVFNRLCQRGQGLAAWCETVYEPEEALFGGAAAMHAVHRLFDTDTLVWDRLAQLRARQALPFTDAALALAQTNELFGAALGGRPEEVWDAWCRLAAFHDLAAGREVARRARPTLQALAGHPMAQAAREPLLALAAAQAGAGLALAELAITGQLAQGLRGVLAAVGLFGWNRIGLVPGDRRQVLTQAMGAWHPHVEPLAA